MAGKGKKAPPRKKRKTDPFISHSSANAAEAARVERALESDGLTVWVDLSQIRAGRLLRNELRAALGDSPEANGLGSILFYERDLDSAEFFIRRALALAKAARVRYPAAERDLELVLQTK